MTLKEKIDSFCAKEIVLHVPTKDLFIKVCGELRQRGCKWSGGDPTPNLWSVHCGKTVIEFNNERMVVTNRDRFDDRIVIIITEDDFKAKLCQDPLKQLQEYIKKSDKECVRAWKQLAKSLGVRKSPADDNVNHPAYYTDGSIAVSDFIADKNLNFFRGNVLKYICRAGKKDPDKEIEDLKKAEWYLNREIYRLEWMNK